MRQPFNQRIRHQIRFKAAQANAPDAVHRGGARYDARKIGAGILAVAGKIDAGEHRLGIAAPRQHLQFAQNVFLVAAAHAAACARNNAICAAPVAPVLNLQKSARMAFQQFLKALALSVRPNVHDALARLDELQHVLQYQVPRAGTGDDIRLRGRARLLGKGLRVAAGKHRDGVRVPALGAPQPLAAFFVAARRNGAAVYDPYVRLLVILCGDKAIIIKKLRQRAGLVLVHFAAQRIKCNRQFCHLFAFQSKRAPNPHRVQEQQSAQSAPRFNRSELLLL